MTSMLDAIKLQYGDIDVVLNIPGHNYLNEEDVSVKSKTLYGEWVGVEDIHYNEVELG